MAYQKVPTGVALLVIALLAGPAKADRHWFTDENRHLSTDLFHASASKNAYCDPARRDGDLFISVRFKSDIDFEIGDNRRYYEVLMSGLVPAVRDVCGKVTDLVILNFFSNPLFNERGGEIPASRVILRNLLVDEYPLRIRWVWFDAIFAGDFPSSDNDSFGDSSLTTERAIRAWLSQGTSDQLIANFKDGVEEVARRKEEIDAARRAAEVELNELLRKKLRLGTEAFDSEASGESYRTGVEVFAQVCEAGNMDGCLRLDRALAKLEANCRGESEDRVAKPWACGLYGYALDKSPILKIPHFFKNLPKVRQSKLIRALYQEACDDGNQFYCNLL